MVNLEQVNDHKIYFLYLFLILGKTLLAKAVANQTSATFLRVVGSELIQKYLVNDLNNF
jgi:ATP-dependent 26S proteasome regulatory subunit